MRLDKASGERMGRLKRWTGVILKGRARWIQITMEGHQRAWVVDVLHKTPWIKKNEKKVTENVVAMTDTISRLLCWHQITLKDVVGSLNDLQIVSCGDIRKCEKSTM